MVVAWTSRVELSSSPLNFFGDESTPIDLERSFSEVPVTHGAYFLVEINEFDSPAKGVIDRNSSRNSTDDLPEILRAPASKRRHISAPSFQHDIALTSRAHIAERGVPSDPAPKATVLHHSTEVLLL